MAYKSQCFSIGMVLAFSVIFLCKGPVSHFIECLTSLASDIQIQFGHSVVSDSLRPHEPQHAGPPCPSPTPGVYPNQCPLSQWCHPTISSSVLPFSSCPQSFPASGLFKWFSSLHQVAKVLKFQLQHQSFQWIFRTDFLWQDFLWIDWLDLLAVQGTFKSLLQHHSSKASIIQQSTFFIGQLLHPYMTTGKP